MSKKLSQSIQDWAGVASVGGILIVMLGGWTSLNSRVSVNETNIEAVKEDTSYTRDRVDDLVNHLIEDE